MMWVHVVFDCCVCMVVHYGLVINLSIIIAMHYNRHAVSVFLSCFSNKEPDVQITNTTEENSTAATTSTIDFS